MIILLCIFAAFAMIISDGNVGCIGGLILAPFIGLTLAQWPPLLFGAILVVIVVGIYQIFSKGL